MNTWTDEATWPIHVTHPHDPRIVECEIECCDCDARNCGQREEEADEALPD